MRALCLPLLASAVARNMRQCSSSVLEDGFDRHVVRLVREISQFLLPSLKESTVSLKNPWEWQQYPLNYVGKPPVDLK